MADLLKTIHAEIDARLDELRPSVAEYEQLMVAVGALVENGGRPTEVVQRPKPRAPGAARTRVAAKRGSAAGAIELAASGEAPKSSRPKVSAKKPKPARAQRGAAREAILAALDHGSHTVPELVIVTAMSAANVNGNLRRMVSAGAVVKTEREGKTAYALPKSVV